MGEKQCKFTGEYYDMNTEENLTHECSRPCVLSGDYCAFHDDNYIKTHTDKVVQLLDDELLKQVGHPIFFIGCNIPSYKISSKKLKNHVYFTNAIFHGGVDFIDMQFEMVDFSEAEFYGEFYMYKTNIKNLLFKKTEFHNESFIKFQTCDFEKSSFILSKFSDVDLYECKFIKSDFKLCTFDTDVTIHDCIFKDKVDFTSCIFSGKSIFHKTIFFDVANFSHANFKAPIKFHDVHFKEPEMITFDGDLSNASFLRTNITRIIFDGNTKWGKNDPYEIFDAAELIRNPQDSDLSSILSVYRNLRENYEYRLMYEEAGNFFKKEMELKRTYVQDYNKKSKTSETKPRKHSVFLLSCYKYLSDYGESLRRTIIWAIALFFAASVYFYMVPEPCLPNPMDQMCGNPDLWIFKMFEKQFTAVTRTFDAFFQISRGSLPDYIVRIAALPILGMAFITLRRKFERRFRH